MNASDQIAAINRKRADEHRRVDMQHDQLIQVVRERCVHEAIKKRRFVGFEPCILGGDEMKYAEYFECKHCGAPMGAEQE